jgi:hypothetical protein
VSELEVKFCQLWETHGPTGYGLCQHYPFHVRLWHSREGWQDRRWEFDFALPDHRIAIEIEGAGGRHQYMGGFSKDIVKYNAATAEGWRVLRFMGTHLSNYPWVIDVIEATIFESERLQRLALPRPVCPAPCPICGPECRCDLP